MRRLLTWLGVVTGVLLIVRRLRRRRSPAGPDPADELRETLARSRATEPAPPAKPAEAPEASDLPIDERRRAVHDRARIAIDEMLGGERLPGEESE